jgi:hypothetical protein
MFLTFFTYLRGQGGRPKIAEKEIAGSRGARGPLAGCQQRQSLLGQCGPGKLFVTLRRGTTVQSEKSGTEFRRSFD